MTWAALDYEGHPVFWNPSWVSVVRWCERQGGDMDVVFMPFVDSAVAVKADGDVDVHGDLS